MRQWGLPEGKGNASIPPLITHRHSMLVLLPLGCIRTIVRLTCACVYLPALAAVVAAGGALLSVAWMQQCPPYLTQSQGVCARPQIQTQSAAAAMVTAHTSVNMHRCRGVTLPVSEWSLVQLLSGCLDMWAFVGVLCCCGDQH